MAVPVSNLRHRYPSRASEDTSQQVPLLHEKIYAPPVEGPACSLKNVTKVTAPQERRLKLGIYVGDYSFLFGPGGRGKMKYYNGDEYEGEWWSGNRSGLQGRMTYANGDIYVGPWINDRRATKSFFNPDLPQGRMTYADGSEYMGRWHSDKRCGFGRMTYADGSVYVGDWLEDVRHGRGKMMYPDGRVSEGQWILGRQIILRDGREVLADQSR